MGLRVLLVVLFVVVTAQLVARHARNEVVNTLAVNHPDTGGATRAGQECRPPADECFRDCGTFEGHPPPECAHGCLAALEACAEKCEPPIARNAGRFAAVISDESMPEGVAKSVQWVAERELGLITGEGGGLIRAYVRVAIDAKSGRARDVQAIAQPDGYGPSVSAAFDKAVYPKASANYQVYAFVKP
jgi:hypothetical protein